MKKVKNISKILLLIGTLGLSSCGQNDTSIVVPQFDPNEFKEEVSVEVAQKRVLKAIENSAKVDEMRMIMEVKNLEYGNSLLDMKNPDNFKKEATKGSFKQVSNLSGLTASNPNDIMATYKMQDIELSISKPGICPEEDDHIEMIDGATDYYIKNNRQYVDFSNQTLREFLPYVLFGFGDYKTIDDAKSEAKNVPDKFYLPNEVFKKEDLPLGSGISNLKQEDMEKMFNYIIDLNNETQPKFLSFNVKDSELLMNIDLNGSQIRDILVKILTKVQPDFNESSFIALFNSYVTVNACDMYFKIDKTDHLNYQNINIDFNVKSTTQDDAGNDYIRKDYSVLNMENFIEYKDIKLRFPNDLDKYVPYDLKLPNLPELPIK